MHTTILRKVGGSTMLAVPPALLDLLRLRPGAKVWDGISRNRADEVKRHAAPPFVLDDWYKKVRAGASKISTHVAVLIQPR